jgi:hypothetical protein
MIVDWSISQVCYTPEGIEFNPFSAQGIPDPAFQKCGHAQHEWCNQGFIPCCIEPGTKGTDFPSVKQASWTQWHTISYASIQVRVTLGVHRKCMTCLRSMTKEIFMGFSLARPSKTWKCGTVTEPWTWRCSYCLCIVLNLPIDIIKN